MRRAVQACALLQLCSSTQPGPDFFCCRRARWTRSPSARPSWARLLRSSWARSKGAGCARRWTSRPRAPATPTGEETPGACAATSMPQTEGGGSPFSGRCSALNTYSLSSWTPHPLSTLPAARPAGLCAARRWASVAARPRRTCARCRRGRWYMAAATARWSSLRQAHAGKRVALHMNDTRSEDSAGGAALLRYLLGDSRQPARTPQRCAHPVWWPRFCLSCRHRRPSCTAST